MREASIRGSWWALPLLVLPILLSFGGCAASRQAAPPVSPEEIPALESRLSEAAGGAARVPLQIRLGEAYRTAGRLDEAAQVLELAQREDPLRPALIVQLGLTYEALERPEDARDVYEAFRRSGSPDRQLSNWIDGRIPRLRRQILVLAARQAVQQESTLAQTAPAEGSVAVFPFRVVSADPSYAPLGRGIAELLISDLSQTDRISLLERMRVQLLLDELAFSASERVDPSTAARSGFLLGAGQIILGTVEIEAETVRLEAGVVEARSGELAGNAPVEQDALRQLFEAQKRLVLGIYQGLGIDLTPAERDRILQIRTRSLEALLAYGRGLIAEDDGDYARALIEFREAVRLDPGFQDAADRVAEGERIASADDPPSSGSEGRGEGDFGGGDLPEGFRAVEPGGLGDLDPLIPDPAVRDAIFDATAREGLGRAIGSRSATVEILIRRPQ
jgi:TolB-like protein